MATKLETATPPVSGSQSELQELAKKHLWMHFTRMGAYDDHEVPVIVRGDGCYVWDEHGKRYLDGLAALFCVNAGHGRTEIGEAAAAQVKELGFYTNWSYAHPPAIELAARVAGLAPDGLNRVFFTSGGSEAVESAMKLCRAWHRMNGDGQRIKVIAREIAYHGTTLGALSATGIPGLRAQFEPLAPGGCHVPNTNSYRWPEDRDPLWAAEQIEERILFEGPETVSAVIAHDRIAEPFMEGTNMFAHGITFGGHPVAAAMAMANLDIFEREDLCGHVREKEPEFRAMLEGLHRDLPIVGDVRGAGFFQAIELVKDRETKESFSDEESETLLRGFLSGELFRRGLICRADDRGDPVIQLSPPLIAGPEQFEEMESILRPVLEEASRRMVPSA